MNECTILYDFGTHKQQKATNDVMLIL